MRATVKEERRHFAPRPPVIQAVSMAAPKKKLHPPAPQNVVKSPSRPARKPSKTPSPGALGESLVDRGLKIRWEEALSRYRAARGEEMAGWDERYEALGEILDSDPPYYLAGGYKTARAFLAAEVPDQDERTVRTYVRVARYFDPEDEAQYGVTKLDALLDNLEAAGGAPLAPAKIRPAKTKVRVSRQGKEVAIPFADATKEELRAATRSAKAKSGRITKTEPPLVKVLRKTLAKAGLGKISLRLRRDELDFGGVPKDRIAALGKALGSFEAPADE
jgi:hypothetical protein